ncbi:MAG: IctB family putative bicarbonate transporter [Elainellaceae cyanobacterium]
MLDQGSLESWLQSSYLHRIVGLLKSWRQSSLLLRWADVIGMVAVLLIFVAAPFVSTTLIGLLLLLCAAFWMLLTVADDSAASVTWIHVFVGLYWCIATIATVFSPVRGEAFQGWIKLTLYLLLFVMLARSLRSPLWRSVLIALYLHVATFVSIFGLRQWFFGADALATWVDADSSLAGTTRVYSYLGNPNLLGAYLIPAAIFSAAAFLTWKSIPAKGLAVLMGIVNSACLVLTFSRGAWIGFVVAGFVFLLLLVSWVSPLLPSVWKVWALPTVVGGTAAVLSLAVLAVAPLRARVSSIFAGREDSSNNFRINVWGAVMDMIRDRPVLGIGPGNDAFNKIYPFYQEPGYTALSAYSVYLEIAVETGFIGLTCFAVLMIVTFWQAWKALNKLRQKRDPEALWLMGAIAIMVGMLAHGMVDTVWYRPQISTLWWLMVGLVASYAATTRNQRYRVES